MTPAEPDSTVEQLRAELAELRLVVDQLMSGNADLTVRRLAVSDGLGDRITLTADPLGMAQVEVLLGPDSHTSASIFAEPCDAGANVGFSVWTEGNHRASLTAVDTRQPYNERRTVWDAELSIEHDPEPLLTTYVTVDRHGPSTRQSDLRGMELPIRRLDPTEDG